MHLQQQIQNDRWCLNNHPTETQEIVSQRDGWSRLLGKRAVNGSSNRIALILPLDRMVAVWVRSDAV